MLDTMDKVLIGAKVRWDLFVHRLLHEEKGASDMVAILVVIVILLAVAVTFKGELETLVKSVFGKATTWVENPN